MPIQGKFRHEYQKGTPWPHENLIAPFDFAILKTDQELKIERDSVTRIIKPYFINNEDVAPLQIEQFIKNYNDRYKEAVEVVNKLYPNFQIHDSLYLFCKNQSLNLLNFIYSKGVVDFAEILENTQEGSSLVLVKNNIAENREIDEVFTQKIAYSFITKKLKKELVHNVEIITLIENLKIYDFVVQNLNYDEATTLQVKEDLINNIPTKQGMIQAGERIIATGDVIHDEKFRVLESLRKEYENIVGSSAQTRWLITGHIILILLSFLLLYLFLFSFRKEILVSFSKSLFIIMMVLIMVAASSLVVRFNEVSLYLVPFVALPIIIFAFYDSRLAFYIHLVTIMIVGFWAPNAFEFIFLQFVAGAVSMFSMAQLYRRGQLFVAVGSIILTYILAYSALGLMQEGDITKINYLTFLWFAGNGLLLLASYPLIFIFEKMFGFLSDVTLLELSDTNHPALRELAEKAPGTFHHVIQVANLAEEAIRRIGGNSLLMRVGALYHDIGKTGAPGFFIENQGSKNPHEDLKYDKSAEVIIQHVNYGAELAKKYKLPKPIIDFIYTHHGTSLVKYFYTKYSNENEGKVPDIAQFSYPGPSPFTKETAVLMMADAVEAASRTLKEYNESTIDVLVEKIINGQMEDNQFEEADITFRDIYRVKEVLKEKLLNIYHARIEYPEKKY
jgi:putative nucleotidyltransferase with HDIG domain